MVRYPRNMRSLSQFTAPCDLDLLAIDIDLTARHCLVVMTIDIDLQARYCLVVMTICAK